MTFKGTLTDLQSREYNKQTYYTAGVLDDAPPADRLRTEINIGIQAGDYQALQGKLSQPVMCTLRLFRSVRNGIPEFEGRVASVQK